MSYSKKINAVPLEISSTLIRSIEIHGEQSYPNECCGFLFGTEGNPRKITSILPVENAKLGDQRRRFEINPQDYMKAENHALENGQDLLGIYHSHPDHPNLPSKTDLDKAMPYFSYVITSIVNGKATSTASWQLGEEQLFEREEILNTDNANTI